MIGALAFAAKNYVGFADGVCLRIYLLTPKVRRYLLASLFSQLFQCLFRNGKHAAGAQRSVVKQISSRFNLVRDWEEEEISHQLNRVARRPVFTCFFIVLSIEATNQL